MCYNVVFHFQQIRNIQSFKSYLYIFLLLKTFFVITKIYEIDLKSSGLIYNVIRDPPDL